MARRKRGYSGELRSVKLTLQLTPTERADMAAAATEAGTTLSDYSRALCCRRTVTAGPAVAAMRRDPHRAALLRELTAIGNNLNQLARLCNTVHSAPQLAEIEATMATVQTAIAKVIGGR